MRSFQPSLILPFLLLVAHTGLGQQSDPLDGFDAYVARAVRDWNVPGLAVAVVSGGKTVFAKGYGVRRLSSPQKVDTRTLFANASTTKAFTAAAVGMLVDEGKLDWNEPVISYLPTFRLKDPYVTAEVRVKDLLTHNTGVAPVNAWATGLDTKSYVRNLRNAPQESSLRSSFNYNNDMYVVAGELIGAVSGVSWEEFVTERILRPIGMNDTRTTRGEADDRLNTVVPHDLVRDTVREIPYPSYVNAAAPAGSMQSNVEDMARWIAFLLDSARVDGERLIEPGTFSELFRPQALLARSEYPAAEQAGSHFFAYGMGWFLQDYKGKMLAMHTGSLHGLCAIVALLPELNVGLVVFENIDHAELRHALMYDICDRFLGDRTKDWSTELLTLYADLRKKGEERRKEREEKRVAGTTPSLPDSAYAGTYRSEIYGDITVSVKSTGLVATFDGSDRLTFDLMHWQYDVFKGTSRGVAGGDVMIQFVVDARGRSHEVAFGVDDGWLNVRGIRLEDR